MGLDILAGPAKQRWIRGAPSRVEVCHQHLSHRNSSVAEHLVQGSLGNPDVIFQRLRANQKRIAPTSLFARKTWNTQNA